MFSRIIFLVILTCSVVRADNSYIVGELVVLSQPTDAEQTKWIIPEGYEAPILQTRTQLATIPTQSGKMEFLFVEVGEAITYTRISIEIRKTDSIFPLSIRKKVKENPFDAIAVKRRSSPLTNDTSPIIIMYKAPYECIACDKWKEEVYPKLSVGGWKYAVETTGKGIDAFPSFEIRLGSKKSFHEGYLTMDEINTILDGLK